MQFFWCNILNATLFCLHQWHLLEKPYQGSLLEDCQEWKNFCMLCKLNSYWVGSNRKECGIYSIFLWINLGFCYYWSIYPKHVFRFQKDQRWNHLRLIELSVGRFFLKNIKKFRLTWRSATRLHLIEKNLIYPNVT